MDTTQEAQRAYSPSLMYELLSHACGWLTTAEIAANGGWQSFSIELHCVMFTVNARHVGDDGSSTEYYEINSWTKEDC